MVPRGAKPLAQVLIMDGPEKLKIHQKRKKRKKKNKKKTVFIF